MICRLLGLSGVIATGIVFSNVCMSAEEELLDVISQMSDAELCKHISNETFINEKHLCVKRGGSSSFNRSGPCFEWSKGKVIKQDFIVEFENRNKRIAECDEILRIDADAERDAEQPVVTASKCNVRIDQFKSKCDFRVRLLDNQEISVLFVTVKSIPETYEISFYTEYEGILVVSVDGQMIPLRGSCKNDGIFLRCSSEDKKAVLEIQW